MEIGKNNNQVSTEQALHITDVIGRLFTMSHNVAKKHKAAKDRVLFTITECHTFIHFYEISNDEERVERFLESVSVNDL